MATVWPAEREYLLSLGLTDREIAEMSDMQVEDILRRGDYTPLDNIPRQNVWGSMPASNPNNLPYIPGLSTPWTGYTPNTNVTGTGTDELTSRLRSLGFTMEQIDNFLSSGGTLPDQSQPTSSAPTAASWPQVTTPNYSIGGGGGGGGSVGGGGASGQATDVYGGIDWKRLELEAMIQSAQLAYQYWIARGSDAATARQLALQAAQQRMNADLSTGYVRQGGYTPDMAYGGYSTGAGYSGYANPMPSQTGIGQGIAENVRVSENPTREDALLAIYENRPDIKAFYDSSPEWASKSPTERMNNWLGMTNEAEYAGKTDAELIEVARKGGYLMTQAEKDAAEREAASGGTTGASGWYPTFYDENNPPTEDAALWAIWQNDYAAREQYGAQYPNDWRAAMNAWKADNNMSDAVSYAKGKGWLQVAGPLQKTLERENLEKQWEAAELERARLEQNDRNTFVMQYLNNLSSKKGPEDWISYWKYQRGVNDNTDVPTWLTAAQQQYNLPAWGVNYGQQAGQQAQGGVAGQNAQGGYSADAIQNWQNQLTGLKPWQMNVQQWNQMLPSEQSALLGGIDSSGGYGEDWYAQMQKAAPKGSAVNYTTWR